MASSAIPWRVRQIRQTGAALSWLGRLSPAQRLIHLLRTFPVTRDAYRLSLGYQRSFDSLLEAEAAVAAYARNGHQHPSNIETHLKLSKSACPSDYAALFHMLRLLPRIRRVFDLGGNVGNLYYCYSRFITFSDDFSWQVHDLPDNMARGRVIASTAGADKLSFVDSWLEASGADLLLISGALHYMREPLASMLEKLGRLPEHILINRTPVTEGDAFSTVQDGGQFLVACTVQNRHVLLKDLERLEYQLEDSWQAMELALRTPADPVHTVPYYSGFLLRRP